ncbi:MAG: T9SS type A sorting domain-containing protein [Sphingobacteriales bacterium]|nr:MAG: T9SS type A sorting domain-containing protein [Sphingobacteriales bacterium]
MKKLLLTFIIFSTLSGLAYSQGIPGDLLAMNTVSQPSHSDDGIFDNGQPENGVVFYPNPVKDFMSVRFPDKGNYTVRIFNIIGEKITEKTAYDVEIVEIKLTDLQKGMYFVSYEFGGKVVTKRFSKS